MENISEKKNELDLNNQNAEASKEPSFDMSKLDKKSLEILEETEEDDYKFKVRE